MTLAEVLDVMSNDELLEIVQDGQDIYTGYLALLVPERGHGYSEIYERYKDAPVTKMAIKDEVKHRRWRELNLLKPLLPEQTPDYQFSELQLTIYRVIYIGGNKENEN